METLLDQAVGPDKIQDVSSRLSKLVHPCLIIENHAIEVVNENHYQRDDRLSIIRCHAFAGSDNVVKACVGYLVAGEMDQCPLGNAKNNARDAIRG